MLTTAHNGCDFREIFWTTGFSVALFPIQKYIILIFLFLNCLSRRKFQCYFSPSFLRSSTYMKVCARCLFFRFTVRDRRGLCVRTGWNRLFSAEGITHWKFCFRRFLLLQRYHVSAPGAKLSLSKIIYLKFKNGFLADCAANSLFKYNAF